MQKFSKCKLTQIKILKNVVQTSTITIERELILYHANLRQAEGGQAKAKVSQVSVGGAKLTGSTRSEKDANK